MSDQARNVTAGRAVPGGAFAMIPTLFQQLPAS